MNYVCDPTRNYVTMHPHDCQSFLVCVSGKLRINRCAKNLIFDPVHSRCDVRENVICVAPQPDVQVVCNPSIDFYLQPNPTNCNAYFICLFGVSRPSQCAPELLFDSVSRQCNTPANSVCARP